MAWTNQSKSASPSFSNESRNSATFANQNKGDLITFDEVPLSVLEAETFNGAFRGKPIDDWAFNDVLSGTFWSNQTRN